MITSKVEILNYVLFIEMIWICLIYIYLLSGDQCTATFVTNEGNKFPNTVGVRIDDNTYVFGQNTEGWLKMVAVDSTGAMLATRYGPYINSDENGPTVVTKERWESGTTNDTFVYSAEDVNMACIGIPITDLKQNQYNDCSYPKYL